MSTIRCPGAERLRASFPDEITCACGERVEMWPDEFEVRCPACRSTVERTVPPACIEWCAAARECVGESLYEKYMWARTKRQSEDLQHKLLDAMRSYFGNDTKRIAQAEKVSAFAGEIMKSEKGHYGIIMAASILHDIGIPEAERKYGSSAAECQEKEGAPIARRIMEKMNIDQKVIAEVCDIISHHHSPRHRESNNFKIVYDADMLANIEETLQNHARGKIRQIIREDLSTEAGREIATGLFINSRPKGEKE